MKKGIALFMVLLFACTFAFSFGLAQNAHAEECCVVTNPHCQDTQGILVNGYCKLQPNPELPCYSTPPECW